MVINAKPTQGITITLGKGFELDELGSLSMVGAFFQKASAQIFVIEYNVRMPTNKAQPTSQ